MSAKLMAILAVGVSQTLLMMTLAGFLLAAQRGLRQELAALARCRPTSPGRRQTSPGP